MPTYKTEPRGGAPGRSPGAELWGSAPGRVEPRGRAPGQSPGLSPHVTIFFNKTYLRLLVNWVEHIFCQKISSLTKLIFFNKKYLDICPMHARALVRAQIADGVTRLADCRRSFSRLPTESRPCLGRSAQARNGSKFDFRIYR